MTYRLVLVLVVVFAANGVAPPTFAQPAAGADAGELETEARARFQLGQLYYSQARFAEAAHEFEAAYATHPHPLLLHNLYLALRDEGDIPGAVAALHRYLASATDLSATDRRLLEGRLATMEHQLPETHATEPTTELATEPATEPSPTTEPSEPATEIDDAIADPAPAPSAPTESGIGIVPGAVVVGIGGAALIGAAIAGGVALGVQSDRDGMCNLPNGACPASLDQNDYANRFAAARDAAWGLLATGIVTAAVGAVLLGVGVNEHADTPPPITAACDGTGCFVSVQGVL
jgi:hypothetical protein